MQLSKTVREIKYSTYLIFHPFKGFWDLKHEKKGSAKAATILLSVTILVIIMRNQFTGYLLMPSADNNFNFINDIIKMLLPFVIWVVSNWGITTLVDGEGSMKDIYISSAYALTPLLLLNIPMLVLSRVIILSEVPFYTFLDSLSIAWFVFLIVIGLMTTHQFTMFKTLGTIVIALVGMVCIIFLAVLFFLLIQQIWNWVYFIIQEIKIR